MSTASIIHAHEADTPTPIRAEATSPPSHPLTTTERSAFVGMQARQRELMQLFNDEERAILAEIEARLGLAPGSIANGGTHTVDPRAWTVVPMPQPATPAEGSAG